MKCNNCGTEFDEGIFCPECGLKVMDSDETARNIVTKSSKKQEVKPESQKDKIAVEGKRNMSRSTKWKWPIIIMSIIIISVLGLLMFSSDDSSSKEELIQFVQNGYLGNYDTVTIKDVLEYVYGVGEWDAGEATDGKRNIVEYREKDIALQFSIDIGESETFQVSGIDAVDFDSSNGAAYDLKVYLDEMYRLYAEAYPESGLYIDVTTSNDTLEGHIGPVKLVEKDEKKVEETNLKKELSAYVDYTEDELLAELGYRSNEYNCYPNESHMNFAFIDGKMNMIMISSPEDVGYTVCGVSLQDSLEEADVLLINNGFYNEGSYETAEGSIVAYVEDSTGYSFSIQTNKKGVITTIIYILDSDDSVDVEIDTENESYAEKSEVDLQEWIDEYIRDAGPCCYLNVWSVDETGVWFAAGIGNSGYLSYRDLRDCNAEWIDDITAVYDDGGGNIIKLSFGDTGVIVEEERENDNETLSIAGSYIKLDNTDLNNCGFVLEDSNLRIISEKDLENLGPLECKIARNEIYARHGRMFVDEQLQNYFESCDWYNGTISAESFELDLLSDVERENAEFISSYEQKMGYK